MKKLLLWDIDGTLLISGGASRRALEYSINRIFSIEASLDDIDFSGRTDLSIFRQFFSKYELENNKENLQGLSELYFQQLTVELPKGEGMLCPGVLEVLEIVHQRDDLVQGLLTGNFERSAQAKLEHFNLWHYFEFGAFGEESYDRNDLGPKALERAHDTCRYTFPSDHIFVIGDTLHDIACGKALSANTIGVATGWTKVEDLAVHNPTHLFKDLSDASSFFQIFDN
jgi:phosphoglycolate phosphatase-like HAD superfamily hydrolase